MGDLLMEFFGMELSFDNSDIIFLCCVGDYILLILICVAVHLKILGEFSLAG